MYCQGFVMTAPSADAVGAAASHGSDAAWTLRGEPALPELGCARCRWRTRGCVTRTIMPLVSGPASASHYRHARLVCTRVQAQPPSVPWVTLTPRVDPSLPLAY